MPNHITTVVRIDASSTKIDEIIEALSYDKGGEEKEGAFPDFNKIIPQPDNIFNQNITSEQKVELNANGIPNWYDWNCENWGTKWNSYDNQQEGDDQFAFETAWSHPFPVMEAMSKMYPDVTFEIAYADEDTGYNVGKYTLEGGEVTYENIPKGGSKEAYEIVFEVKPYLEEDFVLIDGEYEWKEDVEE